MGKKFKVVGGNKLKAKVVSALIVAVAAHFIEKAVDKHFGV